MQCRVVRSEDIRKLDEYFTNCLTLALDGSRGFVWFVVFVVFVCLCLCLFVIWVCLVRGFIRGRGDVPATYKM